MLNRETFGQQGCDWRRETETIGNWPTILGDTLPVLTCFYAFVSHRISRRKDRIFPKGWYKKCNEETLHIGGTRMKRKWETTTVPGPERAESMVSRTRDACSCEWGPRNDPAVLSKEIKSLSIKGPGKGSWEKISQLLSPPALGLHQELPTGGLRSWGSEDLDNCSSQCLQGTEFSKKRLWKKRWIQWDRRAKVALWSFWKRAKKEYQSSF